MEGAAADAAGPKAHCQTRVDLSGPVGTESVGNVVCDWSPRRHAGAFDSRYLHVVLE
jgi:hypothetical protein